MPNLQMHTVVLHGKNHKFSNSGGCYPERLQLGVGVGVPVAELGLCGYSIQDRHWLQEMGLPMQLPSLGWPIQPDQLVEGGIPRKSFRWLQRPFSDKLWPLTNYVQGNATRIAVSIISWANSNAEGN